MRALFHEHLVSGHARGAQCVAYVRGEKVVDLCGSMEHFYRGKEVKYSIL